MFKSHLLYLNQWQNTNNYQLPRENLTIPLLSYGTDPMTTMTSFHTTSIPSIDKLKNSNLNTLMTKLKDRLKILLRENTDNNINSRIMVTQRLQNFSMKK